MKKRAVRRRWQLDSHGIRRLGTKESGFSHVFPDGSAVRDEKTLRWIECLHIPPAWTDVRIARSDSAPLQAVGLDKKGRTQYRYHSRFRDQREEQKFLRVVEFGESLPKLRRRVRTDLARNDLSRDHVVAAIVRLIDQRFFRIGNDRSAEAEKTFGLTTIRPEHVLICGSEVHFDFIGKWKKAHKRAIEDAQVASVIRRLRQLGGTKLFQFESGGRILEVKDRHVNDYIQSIAGIDFSAKDFRTWAGTLVCSVALGIEGQAETKAERKRRLKKAIDSTAGLLGNTATVCRASYICPRLIDEYMAGKPFEPARASKRGRLLALIGHSPEERTLLRFLRETIADRRRVPRAA
jgi:DNA topoisomerase I